MHEFVRKHRVHYELETEQADDGSRHEYVGVRLRLLALHERTKLGAPGCSRCAELVEELRAFTDKITADAGVADRAETIPMHRKLYQASDEPNADEVALTLRIHCGSPEHREAGKGEDPCFARVRERLAELGVTRH